MCNNKMVNLCLSPKRLKKWISCFFNLKVFAANEKKPLIDVITDQDGNTIRIFMSDEGGKSENGK